VSTVGLDEAVIREYIRNQEEEEKRLRRYPSSRAPFPTQAPPPSSRPWPHFRRAHRPAFIVATFSIDDSVRIPAGERKTLENVARYILRSPVSLSTMQWSPGSPHVLYAPKSSHHDQIELLPLLQKIDALEFLARVITQIPEPRRHLLLTLLWPRLERASRATPRALKRPKNPILLEPRHKNTNRPPSVPRPKTGATSTMGTFDPTGFRTRPSLSVLAAVM